MLSAFNPHSFKCFSNLIKYLDIISVIFHMLDREKD